MHTKAATPAIADAFMSKVETRTARIGVVGLGYVGLPLSLLYCEQGFRVTGFDIDVQKVATLSRGGSYIVRIPPTEIQRAQAAGFNPTCDYSMISGLDAVIICVPTPLDDYHEPDLSFIRSTVEAIAPHVRTGQLIILESTTYPGTTEELVIPLLERCNAGGLRVAREPGQDGFFVAFSPEREDPGNGSVARHDIPKVIGGCGPIASHMAATLYGSIFSSTVLVSSPAAAEMTKLLENIYRCVNIAMVNELKLLCLRMGLDIWEIIAAAKTKPFGFQAFYPGPGLGGHCIPVDPYYLSWKARQFDFHTRFIELAGEINMHMPYCVVNSIGAALNTQKKCLNGAHILLLGVAYKKDIDDLRESPSLTIIELLQRAGAHVSYNDPYFEYIGKGRKYDLAMHSTPLEDLSHFDCVVIATDHSEYDYESIVRKSQIVVDTRNATAGLDARNIVRC
jgi:UDP-N-acetyl-D-glucosamine dehydrogenase